MCKHQYRVKAYGLPEQCYLTKYYDENALPVDKEGYCLFHSTDLAWKQAFDFPQMIVDLLQAMERGDDKNCDLRGLITDIDEDEPMVISDVVWLKSINLSGSVFNRPLSILNCHFRQSLFLDEVVLNEAFDIEHCQFEESFTSIGKSIFYKNFHCKDVRFGQLFDIKEAIFRGQISCSGISFNGYTVWDKVQYFPQHYAVAYFRFSCNEYTTFNETVWNGPVHFDEVEFNGDTNFLGADFRKELYFVSPRINANVRFFGQSSEAQIFSHEVNMTLDDGCFVDAGQILFEHANLMSLNKETKSQLPLLKANRQIVLGEGCSVYRIAFQRVYPLSTLNAIFLEDLTNTIRQYFFSKLGKYYEVVFFERNNDFVVTFYTDDYLSEADFRQDELTAIENLRSPEENNVPGVDAMLKRKFQWQFQQAISTIVEGYLRPEVLKDILSEVEISLMLKEAAIEKVVAENVTISNVIGSNIYVARLEGLKNDPSFSLADDQFSTLKAELQLLQKEQWKALETLLLDIKKEVVSKDRIVPFLAETGVGIANNLSAGVLFIILERLLLS